jgi:DNA processing protein
LTSEAARQALRPWLILARAPGVGPRTFGRLLGQYGSPERVLAAPPSELRELGVKGPALAYLADPDPSHIEGDLGWLGQPNASLLTLHDPRYPPLLAELSDPPPLLFVLGDAELLSQPQLALVGSRNPTPGGLENARAFARELAGCGLVITSGLAIGIDAAAHEGALARGQTLAVLGTGPDRVYPASQRDLAHRIASGGALVTELPPGVGARAEHFPRRNRLISGLSLGTLVVEATPQSGSLITARLAAEQGREVFAIPGSIHNPLARGCHTLIRQGAKLVESAQDILEELAPLLGALPAPVASFGPSDPATSGDEPLDEAYRALLGCMDHDPIAPDELIARSGLSPQQVAAMLLILELRGQILPCPGGRYCRGST